MNDRDLISQLSWLDQAIFYGRGFASLIPPWLISILAMAAAVVYANESWLSAGSFMSDYSVDYEMSSFFFAISFLLVAVGAAVQGALESCVGAGLPPWPRAASIASGALLACALCGSWVEKGSVGGEGFIDQARAQAAYEYDLVRITSALARREAEKVPDVNLQEMAHLAWRLGAVSRLPDFDAEAMEGIWVKSMEDGLDFPAMEPVLARARQVNYRSATMRGMAVVAAAAIARAFLALFIVGASLLTGLAKSLLAKTRSQSMGSWPKAWMRWLMAPWAFAGRLTGAARMSAEASMLADEGTRARYERKAISSGASRVRPGKRRGGRL